jgi:hypothetical protein
MQILRQMHLEGNKVLENRHNALSSKTSHFPPYIVIYVNIHYVCITLI